MTIRPSATLLAALTLPAVAAAQGAAAVKTSGLRPLLPRDREVALARSAAPANVSQDATILVLQRGGYVVAVEGTNGVTCLVDRSQPKSLEPHCYDAEGSATVLQMRLRQAALREEGLSAEEIDRRIAEELRLGKLRLPSRPVMTYMMSAAQDLYDDEGNHAGAWKPHLMIYYPYLTAEGFGLGGPPSTAAAVVVDPGTPYSNIMIVVREFVDPDMP